MHNFQAEFEIPKGVIRYALSDRTFIEKGWTMLPTEKVVRKVKVSLSNVLVSSFNLCSTHQKNVLNNIRMYLPVLYLINNLLGTYLGQIRKFHEFERLFRALIIVPID